MAETTFDITYDGPALEDGRMAVRDLAPALLAAGNLLTETSALLYPDREPVALHIEATSKGSFDVHLIVEAKNAWDELIDVFGADGATALANMVQLVFGGSLFGGVFWLIKKVSNRPIKSVTESPKPGVIVITLDDDTTLEVPADVLRLYQSVEIRRKAREVVEPLKREGVNELRVSAKDDRLVVEKGDVPAYELPEAPPEPLRDQEVERHLEIVSVVFEEGRKWRFTDGAHEFSAEIQDEGFIGRVDAGERFGKGDVLRCRLREVQVRRIPGGLRTDYYVLEVLDHLPPPEQLHIGSGE